MTFTYSLGAHTHTHITVTLCVRWSGGLDLVSVQCTHTHQTESSASAVVSIQPSDTFPHHHTLSSSFQNISSSLIRQFSLCALHSSQPIQTTTTNAAPYRPNTFQVHPFDSLAKFVDTLVVWRRVWLYHYLRNNDIQWSVVVCILLLFVPWFWSGRTRQENTFLQQHNYPQTSMQVRWWPPNPHGSVCVARVGARAITFHPSIHSVIRFMVISCWPHCWRGFTHTHTQSADH